MGGEVKVIYHLLRSQSRGEVVGTESERLRLACLRVKFPNKAPENGSQAAEGSWAIPVPLAWGTHSDDCTEFYGVWVPSS